MSNNNIKSLYKKLPKEIFCCSLNTNIKVTRAGFEHVFRGKMRKQEEILNRQKCIEYIQPLLESINIYQFHQKEISLCGNREYWNIQGVVENVCIHVTIRKIGNQKSHLYSWHWKGQSPKIVSN